MSSDKERPSPWSPGPAPPCPETYVQKKHLNFKAALHSPGVVFRALRMQFLGGDGDFNPGHETIPQTTTAFKKCSCKEWAWRLYSHGQIHSSLPVLTLMKYAYEMVDERGRVNDIGKSDDTEK